MPKLKKGASAKNKKRESMEKLIDFQRRRKEKKKAKFTSIV